MPSCRYTRIEITPEAYLGLEAEAIIQGKTLKRLASELIIKGVSQKALRFVSEDVGIPVSSTSLRASKGEIRSRKKAKLSENKDAIETIKTLWSQQPRPSQREIARQIGYPASSTKLQIKKMIESGDLPQNHT